MFIGNNIPLHPHVYSNGHICLSILTDDWSPALSVTSVCLSIVSMLSSCTEKKRPPDNAIYVRTCNKNPKKTRWYYHDDEVWPLLFYFTVVCDFPWQTRMQASCGNSARHWLHWRHAIIDVKLYLCWKHFFGHCRTDVIAHTVTTFCPNLTFRLHSSGDYDTFYILYAFILA